MFLINYTLLLLLAALTIKAKDLNEKFKKTSNQTTFLPYTLKVKLNNKGQETYKDLTTPNKDEDKPQEKQALSLYEEQNDIVKPTANNQWKRLITYLPTESPLQKYHENTYLSKTPSYHIYEQHHPYPTTLQLGSMNFPLIQMLSVVIQLAIISYILLGSVTLFHRLLSLLTPTVNTLSDGFSGNFYKSDL